eukprot:scaffold224265_cov25-Prasinocladus_malaysianus.AAC.1
MVALHATSNDDELHWGSRMAVHIIAAKRAKGNACGDSRPSRGLDYVVQRENKCIMSKLRSLFFSCR